MKVNFLLIALCSLTQLGSCTTSAGTDEGLFVGNTDILSLNDVDLMQNIFHQHDATFAVFYSSWCGHCQKMAPKLKQFAKDIRKWRAAVKVVAINCYTYSDACDKMKIIGYPTAYFFEPKSDNLDDGVRVGDEALESSAAMYNAVLKLLNKAHYGLVLPSLVARKEEMCSAFPVHSGVQKLYAIIEETSSVTSAEIILNLLNYRDVVQIKRFYGKSSSLVESLSSIHISLPAILEVKLDDCTFRSVMNSGQNMQAMKYEFEKMIRDQYPRPDPEIKPDSQVNSTSKPTKVTKYQLSYIDLYNTMRFSVLNEMMKYEKYEQHHVYAIKQYFSTMLKYFPFRNENVRRLFKRMNIWLANKDASNLNRVKLREAVRISDGFLWPQESYRFCNGSDPRYRGYSCGLWVLFHVLTVNEYMNPPAGGIKHDVLFTMRNYTTYFFTCKYCAKHFFEATSDMANELIYPNSSVLFLWRIHNQVNHRLQGDVSEDPCFPKMQFPSKKMCQNCAKNNEFELPEVLSFLTGFYGKKSISNGASSLAEVSFIVIFMPLAAWPIASFVVH